MKRIANKGFEKKLAQRAKQAIDAGELPPCTCWDCIRTAGLTPPKAMRSKHPARYPYAIFDKDLGGEPSASHTKREEVSVGGSEGANLREAVRNRSAI